jgi:chemotaxis protein histidine kinase CheA
VPPSSVDRFSERLERVDLIHKELFSAAEIAREVAARQREVSSSLLEALRLMSAREAWGPPAPAVERITRAVKDARVTAAAADRGAALCRRNAESLHALVSRMQAELAAVRRTSVASLFQRVARAVERIATQEGRRVRVHLEGGEVPIDRRAAEQLLEPLLQLARNAVAHGILRPEQRRSLGKPEEGIVAIVAERAGDWLRIIVEDDGSGIDVERVRTLAIERGLLEAERASIASDEELLELLFAPGLTTQTGADFLAGRGVGLDLAQEAAHRMGGAIRLAQRPGGGLSATLEVPLASGMVDVVWLKVGGHRFALPVINSGRVREPDQASLLLAECLGIARAAPPKAALELRIASAQPLTLGVDEVGEIEEVAIRPIPDLIARAGPYTGAVLRPDGSLALVLDAALLAARAWCRATQST